MSQNHDYTCRWNFDSACVVDIGGYICNSARSEITYAISIGKEVLYHSKFISSKTC